MKKILIVLGMWMVAPAVLASGLHESPTEKSKAAFTNDAQLPWHVTVVPKSAPIGTPRTIIVAGGCPAVLKQDESTAGVLKLRVTDFTCPLGLVATAFLPYTPQVEGALAVKLYFYDGNDVIQETSMTTTAGARPHSSTDISGMWYDPATSGSGISFHHNPASDAVFGTWFMFGSAGTSSFRSRWFSLQAMQWVSNNVLEGIALESASKSTTCLASNSCPLTAGRPGARGIVRVTLTGGNEAKIEAFDLFGAALFTSNLTRIRL
ncbi:MAG: hypothetical protein JNN20_01785 [Betaproteobacteria bacterium]|nr:hypothetical protein [Betaproteobacteria bacterium]